MAAMGMEAMGASTARRSASSLTLLRQATGTPQDFLEKILRLANGLAVYAQQKAFRRRLELLRRRGLITQIPSRPQIAFGGLDMLRFFISPGAADYYQSQGINFSFHQLLRILEEPLSMTDPVGLLSSRDNIIGHVMQVVHADATYDLQLLEMFEDGLDQIESQVEAMLAGTHPRYRSIQAIVEDPDYHRRLLAFIQAHRRGDDDASLVRENLDDLVKRDPEYAIAAKQFATLPAAFRYFNRLPRSWSAGLRHFMAYPQIDRALLD